MDTYVIKVTPIAVNYNNTYPTAEGRLIDMLAEQIKETYGEVDSIWLNIKKREGRYRAVIMVGVQE